MTELKIALAGNPNCGKTTVFNSLTGSNQKVANWSGVTVEKKIGKLALGDFSAELVDLPGVYSFTSSNDSRGLDEQIAYNYLTEEKPDIILNVVDATNLNRHLILTHELLKLGIPTILLLNMTDMAEKNGIQIDVESLERRLGVPVLPLIASKHIGRDDLKKLLISWAEKPDSVIHPKEDLLCFEETLTHKFHWIKEQTQDVVITSPQRSSFTEKVDSIVLHRFFGIPIFLGVMYLLFLVAINLGSVFIDFFDILLGALLVDGFAHLLAYIHCPTWLITILANGVGGGIQLVGTFIPVIGFLYLCLSILEDSGYMARAAFVVDRLMSQIGLPGTSFVPLIVGFGCNVPSVMASRSLTREQDRLLTIAMSPFMSCGARLTVYALFAAAFFPSNGTFIVFALYLLGIFMALFTGWLFRKTLFSGSNSPSFQEMPAYHKPVPRNILMTTWHRLYGFVVRAGLTIIQVVTVLTVINSISLDGSFGHQDSKSSLLSTIGKTITPIFSPIGVHEDNWPATVGVFTGVFAKEAVVGTLDALYMDVAGEEVISENFNLIEKIAEAFVSIKDNLLALGGALLDPLGLSSVSDSVEQQGVSNTGLVAMQSLFGSGYAAFCYLVLILLYTPCVAVIGAMKRESGAGWALLVVGWSSFLAYWTASCLYQAGTLLAHPVFSSIWLLCGLISMAAVVKLLNQVGQKRFQNSDIIATSSSQ